jgi:hypothetical protein
MIEIDMGGIEVIFVAVDINGIENKFSINTNGARALIRSRCDPIFVGHRCPRAVAAFLLTMVTTCSCRRNAHFHISMQL